MTTLSIMGKRIRLEWTKLREKLAELINKMARLLLESKNQKRTKFSKKVQKRQTDTN